LAVSFSGLLGGTLPTLVLRVLKKLDDSGVTPSTCSVKRSALQIAIVVADDRWIGSCGEKLFHDLRMTRFGGVAEGRRAIAAAVIDPGSMLQEKADYLKIAVPRGRLEWGVETHRLS
jgi:hypothetical protein